MEGERGKGMEKTAREDRRVKKLVNSRIGESGVGR